MKKLTKILSTMMLAATVIGCSSSGGGASKTNLELVTSLDQAILALSTGKCDAVALDGTTAQNYVDQSEGQFAMTGINFDLTMYGDYEGNIAIAKKGEKSLIDAVNTAINYAKENDYYTYWTAIAKLQSGKDDDEARSIAGDDPIFTDIPVDDTYAYLYDVTKFELAKVDVSNAEGVLKSVMDKGVLTIATSPDYPANEFITEDGTVYGSEMMLAKYVADCLGVKLKIETMDFNAVLTAVDTGKVDIAFSGFGWKKDRAETFELSIGYVGDSSVTFHTLIVPADQKDNYKSLEDFVGKHIVAQASSLQQMYVEDQIIGLEK